MADQKRSLLSWLTMPAALPTTPREYFARLPVIETPRLTLERLAAGETLEALNAEFSADSTVPVTTEQIHRDSTVFSEAVQAGAYCEEMAAPGDCTAVVSGDYVLLLYYQADVPAGPVELTEAVHDALAYTIYSERTQAAMTSRIEELAAAAEVVIY